MYKIVRFRRKSSARPRIIKRGLTLAEARRHCSMAYTRGPKLECGLCSVRQSPPPPDRCPECGGLMVSDWFDGYQET